MNQGSRLLNYLDLCDDQEIKAEAEFLNNMYVKVCAEIVRYKEEKSL